MYASLMDESYLMLETPPFSKVDINVCFPLQVCSQFVNEWPPFSKVDINVCFSANFLAFA